MVNTRNLGYLTKADFSPSIPPALLLLLPLPLLLTSEEGLLEIFTLTLVVVMHQVARGAAGHGEEEEQEQQDC